MNWLTVTLAVLLAAIVFVGHRALVRHEVREFLLRRELSMYRGIVNVRDAAALRNECGDIEGAARFREYEKRTRERLARFKAVRDQCIADKVGWYQMVRLLHAEGLYESEVELDFEEGPASSQ